VLRREHEACLGTVQVSLQRIEEALSRKD
jgi:hypothetical protein